MTKPLRTRIGIGAIGGDRASAAPRRAPFVVLVVALLLGALTALLTLNTLAAADELEQQGIAADNAVAAARVQALDVDLSARRAPGALARAATALGLVPATQPAFLRVNPDGSVTLLGQPGAVAPPPIALEPPPAGSTARIPDAATPTPTGAAPAPTTPAAPATSGPPPAPPAVPAPLPAPSVTVTLPGGAR